MISVSVLFFASLRDELGLADCKLELERGDIDALKAALATRLGADAGLLWVDNVRLALNQTVQTQAQLSVGLQLSNGDELAFLPPITGG